MPRELTVISDIQMYITYIRTDKYTYIWTDDGRADKLICICRFAPKCKCSEEHKVLSKPTVISGVRTKQYCPFAPTNTRTSLPLFCLWRACLSFKKRLAKCCENNYCIPLIISFQFLVKSAIYIYTICIKQFCTCRATPRASTRSSSSRPTTSSRTTHPGPPSTPGTSSSPAVPT